MKRDLSLFREILLRVEEQQTRAQIGCHWAPGDPPLGFAGHTSEDVCYNLMRMLEAGLFATGSKMAGRNTIKITGISADGHDYLDAVRDPDVWRETRSRAEKAGGWTLGMIKDIGLAVIKGELQKHGLPIG